jgi:chromosome segregation ATPase
MSHREAAAAVKAYIKQFKQLAAYAEALEGVANLEDEAAAAKTAAVAAKSERDKLQAAVKVAQGKLAELNAKVEDSARISAGLAAETLSQAKAEATLILVKAKAQAEDIVAKAGEKGAAGKAALEADVAGLRSQLQSLRDQITDGLNQKQALEAEITALNGKIEGAKAKIAALLQG